MSPRRVFYHDHGPSHMAPLHQAPLLPRTRTPLARRASRARHTGTPLHHSPPTTHQDPRRSPSTARRYASPSDPTGAGRGVAGTAGCGAAPLPFSPSPPLLDPVVSPLVAVWHGQPPGDGSFSPLGMRLQQRSEVRRRRVGAGAPLHQAPLLPPTRTPPSLAEHDARRYASPPGCPYLSATRTPSACRALHAAEVTPLHQAPLWRRHIRLLPLRPSR